MRPNWDEYFLLFSYTAALRSTCLQAKHGCVLVHNKQIISTGFNGSPKGEPHCNDIGCKMLNNHCLRCRHAEINAVINALRLRENLNGMTAYITGTPCLECTKSFIREGIKRVVCGRNYGDYNETTELLKKAQITFDYIDVKTLEHFYKLDQIGIKTVRVNKRSDNMFY